VVNDFERIEGEHSIQDDLAAVNLGYGLNSPADRQRNCGSCVVAYELRRRGFDVVANPRLNIAVSEWSEMFEDFIPQKFTGGDKHCLVEELIREISKWGAGARGTIYGAWDGWCDAHVFSVEVHGDKVMFVDSQNNNSDVAHYLGIMEPTSIIYGRLDNLKPSSNVENNVSNRRQQNDI
jgi:hypothetical protein